MAHALSRTLTLRPDDPMPNSFNPSGFFVLGDKLIFTAREQVRGRELWVTDGTTNGTQLLCDLPPVDLGSSPEEWSFEEYKGLLHFVANGQHWVTDGNSTCELFLDGFGYGFYTLGDKFFYQVNSTMYVEDET